MLHLLFFPHGFNSSFIRVRLRSLLDPAPAFRVPGSTGQIPKSRFSQYIKTSRIVFQDARARERVREAMRASNALVNARRNEMREEKSH